MKPRITIIGNLVKDAENITNRYNQKQCKFLVAVNIDNQKNGYYIDCFLNTHLSEEQMSFFKKGILCTFIGRYSDSLNKVGDNIFFNRTLNIVDFYASKIKNPFNKNMTINFVGYLMDKPIFENDKTIFELSEKIFTGSGENKRFKCTIPYILSDSSLLNFKENNPVFVFGHYKDILSGSIDLYINRAIEVKDYEVLEQEERVFKIGDMII